MDVFYHVYVPTNNNYWIWWIDQQLGLIRESGLYARVHLSITSEFSTLQQISQYVNRRYGFVHNIFYRDIADHNIYEGATLRLINDIIPRDGITLYIHNKGMTSGNRHVSNWREILNHYMITKWRECSFLLKEYDVVGVADRHCINSGRVITSGNFWWANNYYLRTLKDPIKSEEYCHIPSWREDYRYAFERWITSNNPHLGYIIETGIEHYEEDCFLEQLKEIKK